MPTWVQYVTASGLIVNIGSSDGEIPSGDGTYSVLDVSARTDYCDGSGHWAYSYSSGTNTFTYRTQKTELELIWYSDVVAALSAAQLKDWLTFGPNATGTHSGGTAYNNATAFYYISRLLTPWRWLAEDGYILGYDLDGLVTLSVITSGEKTTILNALLAVLRYTPIGAPLYTWRGDFIKGCGATIWAELNKFAPTASGTHAGGTAYNDAATIRAIQALAAPVRLAPSGGATSDTHLNLLVTNAVITSGERGTIYTTLRDNLRGLF